MLIRRTTVRFAVAVLALLGQLTPAVAAPLFAAIHPKSLAKTSGCAPDSCSCPVIEKMTKGCCCANPEATPTVEAEIPACCAKPAAKPKAKSCCEPLATECVQPVKSAVASVAIKTAPRGKCSCDRSPAGVAAEPAALAEVPASELPTDPLVVRLPAPARGILPNVPNPPHPPPPRS